MAHFAKLNQENIVTDVVVISNDVCIDEASGQSFIANVLKLDGVWKQTSYNTYRNYRYTFDNGYSYTLDSVDYDEWSLMLSNMNLDETNPPKQVAVEYLGSVHRTGGTPFRGQYARIGDIYDAVNDVFITPVIEEPEIG